MNWVDFYSRLYSLLRNYSYVPYWVMTPFRKIVRLISSYFLPRYLSKKTSLSTTVERNLIVSLTSFPKRIEYAWMVVECMLRQSVLPEKIILWLSREQFPSMDYVPLSLTERQNEIFEIRLVEGDIKSHKKYFYVAKEYPNAKIFIIDDDIYYQSDIIERSLKKAIEYHGAIISNYGLRIKYDKEGNHLPYNQWPVVFNNAHMEDFFFGSGGGTLMTTDMFYKDFTNIGLATKLCPLADDVWLNAMARLQVTKSVFIPNGNFLPMIIKGDTRLASVNNGLNKNDEQIKAIEDYYGRCFDKKALD